MSRRQVFLCGICVGLVAWLVSFCLGYFLAPEPPPRFLRDFLEGKPDDSGVNLLDPKNRVRSEQDINLNECETVAFWQNGKLVNVHAPCGKRF